MHTNKRAILKANVLNINSLDCLSPLVKKAFVPKEVIAKNNVGIQKCDVLR
jgi:hypothetical protein